MTLIADIFLAAGAIGAAFYCLILSRRLKKFNNLENGMGGAVATLSVQVDDLRKTLDNAQSSAAVSAAELTQLTARAEDVRRQLELQMASLHDILPAQPNQRPAHLSKPSPTAKQEIEPIQPTDSGHEPMFTRRRRA